MLFRNVLAVETSCDDTSVAIVTDAGFVRLVLSADQNLAHEAFGGIVPEIASRNHTYHLMPLIDECLRRAQMSLNEIDAFVVTSRPGLIGSLLVGLVAVKSLALATNKPFIGVNHLEGHLLAPFLSDSTHQAPQDFDYPYVALAISGGHTSLYKINGLGDYEVLGQTIDDAAGEAFDKFGKMVGLGFPGGVKVDLYAQQGDRQKFAFTRSMMNEEHMNFSFSGMKSAARRMIDSVGPAAQLELAEDLKHPPRAGVLSDLCAGFQEAVVDVLINRLQRAVTTTGLKRVVLTGGVSANTRLRERALAWGQSENIQIVVPPLRYCTDNAAMIGFAGVQRLNRGEVSEQSLGPQPRAPLGVAKLPDNFPAWLVKAKAKA